MKPALFIGRFQPFHLGHLDAVRQILRTRKKIIIGIGSAQYSGLAKNPFAAGVRKKMIAGALRAAGIPKGKFTIVKIPDIHDDTRWVAHVERLCPAFGEIWSGTPKVQKLFKKNGKYKVVKPKMNVRISGTEIRKKMKEGKPWEKYVHEKVKCLISH